MTDSFPLFRAKDKSLILILFYPSFLKPVKGILLAGDFTETFRFSILDSSLCEVKLDDDLNNCTIHYLLDSV